MQRHEEGDDGLINALFVVMAKAGADYSLSFRLLPEGGEDWLSLFGAARTQAHDWLGRYHARAKGEGEQATTLRNLNPKYVLRNWVAETAIRAVEDQGDVGPLDRILRLLQSPYDEHPGDEALPAAGPGILRPFGLLLLVKGAKNGWRGRGQFSMVPAPWNPFASWTASPPPST